MDNIFAYVRAQRQAYENDTIEVVTGYHYSQRKTIEKITKYHASQYDGDNKDAILGELPFDNITTEPVEKETESTDFDNADIEVRPKKNTRESRMKNMIATKALREYLERNHFANTLNQICYTRAMYGGVLVKDTKEGTKVVPWANVITDQSDILSGTIIERHYYTPAEMKAMKGWKNVDEAIATARQFRASDTGNGADNNDTQGHLIEVYEVHGVLPESMIVEGGDEFTFKQYMYVIAGIDWQANDGMGGKTEEGIILYEGDEKELPYKYNARNPIVGRALGVGVVESLFNQQKYHNFTLAEELRMMSIAGKIFFDSDNPDVPNNLLTKLDHGTVLKRKSDQSPITQISAVPTGLPGYQNIRAELSGSAKAITGAYESMTGEEGKSNKAFRLAALQNVEGRSRYEQEREELGILIEEIIREWELPRAIKWVTQENELLTHFEASELAEIDEIIKASHLNDFIAESLLTKRKSVSQLDIDSVTQKLDKELRRSGSKRLITDIKEWLKDIDGEVRISTTAEAMNKQAWFESRANLIQLLAPEDPRRNALINRIMDEAGITPDELRLEEEKAQTAQAEPQQPAAPASLSFEKQGRQSAVAQVK